MAATSPEAAESWLVRHGGESRDRVRMRLFCFHYAGATASIFRSWAKSVPDGVEIVAIQLPGREYRLAEPLLTDIGQVVIALAEVLSPLVDKPFAVFGHSVGALIGFDVVRMLRARGLREPELLIASGRNAPQFKWRDVGVEVLSDDEFVEAVRCYNGTPESLLADESLRDLWLPRLRADLTLSARYEYIEQGPLECRILVMFGEQDRLVTDSGLRGWLEQTKGEVRFFACPGDHFFLHAAEERVLTKVYAELSTQLATGGNDES